MKSSTVHPRHRAPRAPSSPAELQARTQQNPRDAQAWAALAEERRSRHDNAGARDALQQLIALHAMTAQTWADYADVLASLNGGSLAGGAGEAIDKALALDPTNTKALWLKASQAHEQQQFSAALQWWQKLRAALPPESPDLRIIDGNIAEDMQLAGLATGHRANASGACRRGADQWQRIRRFHARDARRARVDPVHLRQGGRFPRPAARGPAGRGERLARAFHTR